MKLLLAQVCVLILVNLVDLQYVSKGDRFYHNPYKSGVRYRLNPISFRESLDRQLDDKLRHNKYNVIVSGSDVSDGHSDDEDDSEDSVGQHIPHIPDIPPVKPIKSFAIRDQPIPKPQLFVEDYPEDEYHEPNEGEKYGSVSLLNNEDQKDSKDVSDEYRTTDSKKQGLHYVLRLDY